MPFIHSKQVLFIDGVKVKRLDNSNGSRVGNLKIKRKTSDKPNLLLTATALMKTTAPLATANVPEHREYMAIGVYYDEEIGLQSDIVEVVFEG